MIDISRVYRNPWLKLPKTSPFILVEDLKQISRYGLRPESLGWKTEILPVPYLGNPKKAKIILLCLNPGYNKSLDRKAQKDKYCFKESIKALKFSSKTPFICLDPKLEYTGGYKWWTRLLRSLIREFGLKTLSKKLMCLQYIGYHSKTFRRPPCVLPSQKFTFFLLRKVMKSKKVVVVMRSKHLWFESVPELKDYSFIELKNYRMPYLTERNVKNGSFGEIINSLR